MYIYIYICLYKYVYVCINTYIFVCIIAGTEYTHISASPCNYFYFCFY